LWDIAGKRAGMPVHELLGGRVRAAAATYLHAGGADVAEALDVAESHIERGWSHIRLQVSQPGIGTYGAPQLPGLTDPSAPYPRGWSVEEYLRRTPEIFRAARERLGDEVELLHDVHSRLHPKQAVT